MYFIGNHSAAALSAELHITILAFALLWLPSACFQALSMGSNLEVVQTHSVHP